MLLFFLISSSPVWQLNSTELIRAQAHLQTHEQTRSFRQYRYWGNCTFQTIQQSFIILLPCLHLNLHKGEDTRLRIRRGIRDDDRLHIYRILALSGVISSLVVSVLVYLFSSFQIVKFISGYRIVVIWSRYYQTPLNQTRHATRSYSLTDLSHFSLFSCIIVLSCKTVLGISVFHIASRLLF